ncbi:MAG: hypothetical protein HBSAPP02_09270 [Phycisphaerae bacterium]|nr:MAG: glycosyltransferase family 39 protein [Planctomycetia bacterium]GJQ25895.1 MAG: hypothetical protein HBSAPP02_09270 [Phycisphaerae bacterium]
MANEHSIEDLTGGVTSAARRIDRACKAIVFLATLAIGLPRIAQGGLGWSDAPNHLFDGVFLLEFLRAQPLEAARQWAEQFYLRHPILGIIVYYPPGYAMVEAGIFSILGVSVFAARLTVLLFALGATQLAYALGRRWFDRATGLFAALLLVTCPHGRLWLADVMLEWPATFWILAALYAYQKDRDTRRPWWTLAWGAAVVMAFLTKQTAGFILPVMLLHALIEDVRAWREARRSKREPESAKSQKRPSAMDGLPASSLATSQHPAYLARPTMWISLGISSAVIATYSAFARPYAALPVLLLKPNLDFSGMAHWPAEILGWPLLPIAALGFLTLLIGTWRGPRGLILLWFVAWTGFSLVIAAKEPRYFFFSIAPLCLAAPRFLMRAGRRDEADSTDRPLAWRTDGPRLVLLTLLVVAQAALSLQKDTGPLPDYTSAVAALAERPDADVVLVDAVRDGQFILDAYRNPSTRERIIPLRASKVLYARAAREKYNYQQFVNTPGEIVDLLNRYGIRYLVIESQLPDTPYRDADPPPRQMLRDLLATDARFKLIAKQPLRCNDPAWRDVELRVYAYPECPPRATDSIKLSFPAMNRDVELMLPRTPAQNDL